MCDLSAEGPVVHEEDVEILNIMDYKFLQAVREEELGGIV